MLPANAGVQCEALDPSKILRFFLAFPSLSGWAAGHSSGSSSSITTNSQFAIRFPHVGGWETDLCQHIPHHRRAAQYACLGSMSLIKVPLRPSGSTSLYCNMGMLSSSSLVGRSSLPESQVSSTVYNYHYDECTYKRGNTVPFGGFNTYLSYYLS